jgi:hypothetical protein
MGDLTWKVRVGRVLTEMAIHDTIVGWLGNGGEEVRREVISGVRVVEEVCGTWAVLEGGMAGPDSG